MGFGLVTERVIIRLVGYLVNFAEHTWHSSVRGIDGKFPECSLFLETVPSLLNSTSTMVGVGERGGARREEGASTMLVTLAYIDRQLASYITPPIGRDKDEEGSPRMSR